MRLIKLKIIVPIIAIVVLGLIALNIGSIEMEWKDIIQVILGRGGKAVEIIRLTRIPPIFIALLCGGMLAVSGVLLQAVMKNPLADPSIIGISGGASLGALIGVSIFPNILIMEPILALVFGLIACSMIYSLAWKDNLNPTRIILVGIAINTLFAGIEKLLGYMTSAGITAAGIMGATMTGKTMDDVRWLGMYFILGMTLSFMVYKKCNILRLGEHNAHSLGINVDKVRILISVVAVFMAIIPTIYIGVISFVGLIVPHMARGLVGNDHKRLIPYSALLGACLLLLTDVTSRSIMYPIELPVDVIMALLGVPFFLYIIRKEGTYGS